MTRPRTTAMWLVVISGHRGNGMEGKLTAS